MLASKAFSSTFHPGKPVQEEAFVLFLHVTNGNPEQGTLPKVIDRGHLRYVLILIGFSQT